jgi:hypothetical protein
MNPNVSVYRFARAMREDRGRFAALRDARVLVYWPHGLGDWAHFGHILPLLEPSNRYAIARFGDDYSAIAEGTPEIAVLRSGVAAPSDGPEAGQRHLGLHLRKLNGGPAIATLPGPLDAEVGAFAPDTLLWTDYPETEGRTAYPFHTKARNLARLLVRPDRLASFDLSQPLRSAIDFTASPETQRRLDERLRAFAPPGSRICVVSRSGITAARKNWGDGSDVREFVRMLIGHDARWRVISMDEDAEGAEIVGFRRLFGTMTDPFALTYKALMARTDAFAGVPAGPLHLTLARGAIPTVGVWLAHHPDWYDEPNAAALHLIGKAVRDRGFDRRPATTTKPPTLRHRLAYLESSDIAAQDVFEALRQLM